jgi:diguanylate cyclase (GGDEF)-like protein
MEPPLRVLIVEDSENDALLLVRELRRGGYAPTFHRVDTSESMHAALARQPWDLVITDHKMPRFDSNAALAMVKEGYPDTPVIIVSGSIGEEFAVAAMKAGAQDYLMKGNLMRLVPAVERELREAETRRARRRAEDAIRHMAYHDALTDLVNRSEFERRLAQALSSAKERGLSHALLYMDLDQFKLINDTCGHVAGDELLRQLAVLFQDLVRGNDTLARLGGDEFGALLESCPLEHAEQIAEDFRRTISDFRFVWRDKPFGICVSIGLVPITAHSANVSAMLSHADMACYAAKGQGRNRVHVYSEGDEELARRHGDMQWVPRIKQALEEDRFLLYRQTIVPVLSAAGSTANFEFLIRLRENDGSIIGPAAFIAAAEHYNLMPALDRWVIEHAFAYLGEVYGQAPPPQNPGAFFINLSGTSLSDQSFFEFIHEKLQEHELAASMICFEITETAAICNLGKAVEFIKEIREAGCKFALDDFGSGLSSFSYLKTIPVDFVKIDGSFVRNILNDPMDRAIVEAINEICHVAGIRTVAEFVETPEIKHELQTIGVDYMQGYGVSEPEPIATLDDTIQPD